VKQKNFRLRLYLSFLYLKYRVSMFLLPV